MSFYLTGSEWLYPDPAVVDSYNNYAYSYYFDDPFFRNAFYKSSRIPWIVPLFYLQKLVGPENLSPVINLFGWPLLSLAYFTLCKHLFGIKRSIWALPWIVFFPHLVGIYTGGGTYHGIGANLYFLVGLIFWTIPKRSWFHVFIAGISITFALHCSPVYLNLLPLFPFLEIYQKKNFTWVNYLNLGIASLLATLICCIINYKFGRPFWFFLPQIHQLLALFKSDVHHIWSPMGNITRYFNTSGDFYREGFFLAPYMAAVLFSLTRLKNLHRPFFQKSNCSFDLPLLFFVGIWFMWQCFGAPALNIPDFVYPLQIVLLPTIASWFHEDEDIKLHQILQITLLLFGFVFCASLIQRYIKIPSPFYTITIVTISFFSLLTIFKHPKKNTQHRALISPLFCLGLCYALVTTDSKFRHFEACQIRQVSHDTIHHMVKRLKELGKPDRTYLLYNLTGERYSIYDQGCVFSYTFHPDNIGYFTHFIAGFSFINRHNFQYKESMIESITSSDFSSLLQYKSFLIVLPSTSKTYISRLEQHADQLGFKLELIHKHTEYPMGYEIPYYAYFIKNKN